MSNLLAQIAFEHSLRTEQIIHLGTMACSIPMVDVAQEAFEDDWYQVWAAIGLTPPRLDAEYEGISDAIIDNQRTGFLVQISTPVSCSWSHCWLQWFYGESMEEIYTKAAKWQTEYIDKKREQALSKEKTSC